jgi:hypothetical protein
MVEVPQNKFQIARIAGGIFLLAAAVFVWRHYAGENDRVESMRSAQAKVAELSQMLNRFERIRALDRFRVIYVRFV